MHLDGYSIEIIYLNKTIEREREVDTVDVNEKA